MGSKVSQDIPGGGGGGGEGGIAAFQQCMGWGGRGEIITTQMLQQGWTRCGVRDLCSLGVKDGFREEGTWRNKLLFKLVVKVDLLS